LGALYRGQGISKLQFLIKKYKFFSAVNFFSNSGHQTLDPELDQDPDPQLKKCWIRIRIKLTRVSNPGHYLTPMLQIRIRNFLGLPDQELFLSIRIQIPQ
jgi:hypothetical protein